MHALGTLQGSPYHHILRVVDLGCPVWNAPHSTLPVAELLTEGSVLGLGVPTAVGVMESHVEEEGPECGGEGNQSGGQSQATVLTLRASTLR